MSTKATKLEFPLTSVILNDDRGRRNLVIKVTDEMRAQYTLANRRPFPAGVNFIQQRDGQGRKMQEKVNRSEVYEGRALQVAINRAKRWIRSGRAGTPPAHIVFGLMAFLKADPKQFKHCASEAMA